MFIIFLILYLFYDYNICLISIKDMSIIFDKDLKTKTKNVFFYNNINKETQYANFIIITIKNIMFYSFNSKDNVYNKKLEQPYYSEESFLNEIIKNISDDDNLRWECNKEKINPNHKKYLNIQKISDLVEKNCKKSLEELKTEVPIDKNKFDKLNYIEILTLIIKDNTNKDLITYYLKYLEKNEKKLSLEYINELETFKSEYESYSIMFEKEELKLRGLTEKPLCEKDNFLELLNDITKFDIKNNGELKNKVTTKIKKLNLFNQPIDISNPELYWYRNSYIVYFSLYKLIDKKEKDEQKEKNENNITKQKDENKLESKLNMMKECIKKILDKKLFNKDYIIKSKELLSSIMILISIPQNTDIVEYNLNLVESADKNYDYNKELKTYNIYKNKNENYYIYNYNKINKKLYEPEQSCIKNYVLNINNSLKLDPIEINNYNEMLKYFNEIIDFSKMKKFLSIIFTSQTIKEAFKILYPEQFNFPFKNQQNALEFLDKYYHFIPLKIPDLAAVTERFSMEIYYLLKYRKISLQEISTRNNNILIKKILYRGSCVKSSCHEINHEFYNIYLKLTNGLIPLETPRKKNVNKSESGKNIERLLFGQPIHVLTLSQCLYLLNEKNYNKTLIKFRNGFNELESDDLKFDNNSTFNNFNEILNIENFDKIKLSIINCEEGDNNNNNNLNKDNNNEEDDIDNIDKILNLYGDIYIGDSEDVNDVLGFIRDFDKF